MSDVRLPSTGLPVPPLVAHREWIGGAVTTLLSHYWQDRKDELVAEAALADWMDDLEAFPRGVISSAIGTWRRSEHRRPTPADIRSMCIRGMPKPRPVPLAPPKRERTEEERAAVAAMLRAAGFAPKRVP